MKKLLTILAMAALASTAFGQFIAPPRAGNALTIPSTGYFVSSNAFYLGSQGTNFASPLAFPLQGSAIPSLYIDAGSAVAAIQATQHYTFTFQISADNVKWSGPGAGLDHPALVRDFVGPKAAPVWIPLGFGLTNLHNYRSIRLHSMTNFSADPAFMNHIWITNLWFIQGLAL